MRLLGFLYEKRGCHVDLPKWVLAVVERVARQASSLQMLRPARCTDLARVRIHSILQSSLQMPMPIAAEVLHPGVFDAWGEA